MKGKFPIVIFFVLIASILPDILLNELTSLPTDKLIYIKIAILAGSCAVSFLIPKLRPNFKFLLILTTVSASNVWTSFVFSQAAWKNQLVSSSFAGTYGSSVLLKLFGIIPIFLVLLILFRNPKKFYLCSGNLSAKADKISWLGIKGDTISWGKLSLISAFLIALGTILLVIVTVTKNINISAVSTWVKYIPLILVMAVGNSFCEGLIFRNAMLATLKDNLPKGQVIVAAALFFGIAHYYGAPGGILGVVMAGILGWYMCRSMYETEGLLTAWLIHFVQDAVIFSTIILTGNR